MNPPRPRILAFSGSARKESLNRKFLAAAVEEVRAAGGDVTLVHLADYPMPLYDGDWEDAHGMPEGAVALSKEIAAHAGLLIASPEYNSMITPLLKNTIDWCTRGDANPFGGRVTAVISASPGAFGAVRSAAMVRQLLNKLGCVLIGTQCSLSHADQAFDETGKLRNERTIQSLRAMAAELVRITGRLAE